MYFNTVPCIFQAHQIIILKILLKLSEFNKKSPAAQTQAGTRFYRQVITDESL